MPHTIELKTRVLAGHRIEICSPELPEGQAATVQVTFDQPSAPVLGGYSQELLAAERRYLRDLPQLLRSKPGRWVGYSSQGLIAEGDDELAVFRTCGQQGLQRGQFVVARVEPDLPPAEITENWFPAAAQEA
jgi:hypothetical protein